MLNIPISYEQFLENYAEQQPLLMLGACNKSLMSWQEFDQALQLMEPDEQALQLFLKGQVPGTHYLDNTFELGRQRTRINKYRFYEYLEHGATLALNHAEDFCLIAKKLCHAIGKFSQQPTSSNIYVNFYTNSNAKIAPNEKSSFGKHWDTHDVFIIQLIGEKRWQLFPPTFPLPMSHQTSKQLQSEPPTTPSAEYVLHEGDILYIPRGWWHNVTSMDADTLHLSVGTYTPTLTDYLIWALSTTLPQMPAARRGFLIQDDIASTLKQVLESAMPELLHQKNITDFLQQTQARERLTSDFHTTLIRGKKEQKKFNQCRFSLTSVYPPHNLGQDIYANGKYLRLSPAGRAVIKELAQSNYLHWEDLCIKLAQFPIIEIESSVLDLVCHEVITIQ